MHELSHNPYNNIRLTTSSKSGLSSVYRVIDCLRLIFYLSFVKLLAIKRSLPFYSTINIIYDNDDN